jgi:glucose dehydrogenase
MARPTTPTSTFPISPRSILGAFLAAVVVGLGLYWILTRPLMPSTHAGPPDFARYGGNPSSDGILPGRLSAETAWTFQVHRPLLMESEANGRVYAVSIGPAWPQDEHGTVYALGAAHGRLLWKTRLPNWVMTAPVVDQGRVFVGTGNQYFSSADSNRENVLTSSGLVRGIGPNAVYALSARTGAVLWSYPTTGEDMPTFVYNHGLLLVANGNGDVLALKAATGQLVWSTHIGSYVSMASPVLWHDELVVAGAHPYTVYALNPDTGRLLWRHPLPQVIAGLDDSSLAAGPRYAYTEATLGSWSDPVVAVYAFTPTGKVAWTRTFSPAQPPGHLPLNIEVGAPVYHDGIIYVGSPITDSEMALKAATGQVVWNRRLSGPVSSSALVAHGVALVPVGNGRVAALNARTGHVLRMTNLGGQFSATYPLLLDHTVFLTNLDGQVRAIPWNLLT